MSEINVNLKELKEDIRALIRQGLSFITTCISGMYGITLPINKNHADEISNIKESLMNLKNSINESNIIIADVVKFFNDIETKNKKLLNYLDKKYNVKEIETEEEKVTDNIEDKEDVLTSTETTEKEHTEESADLESVTTEIEESEVVNSQVEKPEIVVEPEENVAAKIEESDTVDSSVESVKVENDEAENVIAEIEESNEVNEQTSTEVVKNETGALEVDRVVTNDSVKDILTLEDILTLPFSVKADSFASKVNQEILNIFNSLRNMWNSLSEGIEELRNKNNYKGLFSEEDMKAKAQPQIDEQISQIQLSFYENNLPQLKKTLIELGYEGNLDFENPEECIVELEKMAEDLNKKLMTYSTLSSISDKFGFRISSVELTYENIKKQYSAVTSTLANYKMNIEGIEFNAIYSKYEEDLLNEFSKVSNVEDVISFDQEDFQKFANDLYKTSNTTLDYQSWYDENCSNIFNSYIQNQYMNAFLEWKEKKYYDLTNLSDDRALKYFTKSEISTYNYIYLNYGEMAALDYLDFMNEELNKREGFAEGKEFIENLNNNVLDYAYSAADSFGEGVKQFGNGITNWILADEDLDVNDYKTMYIMNEFKNNESKYMPFLDRVYNIGMTTGNMAVPVLLTIAAQAMTHSSNSSAVALVAKTMSFTANASMGISAGGNAFDQALEEGNNALNSLTYGVLSGGSEILLERFLGGIPGISSKTANTILNAAGEYREEFTQTFIDAGLRTICLNDRAGDIDLTDLCKEANSAGLYAIASLGAISSSRIVINGVVYSAVDFKFLTETGYWNDYMKNIAVSELTGQSFESRLKTANPKMYEEFMKFKGQAVVNEVNHNDVDSLYAVENESIEEIQEQPNLTVNSNENSVEIFDTSDAGIKKATEAFEINQEAIEEEIVVPEFEPMPTIDTSSNVSLPSNDDIYNPAEIQKGWEELIGNFGEKIRNTSSESFNDNVILPLTEMFEKTKNLFEIKTQEETEISVPNFPPAPTIDTTSNASLSFSNEIYNSDEIQDGWKKILDSLASEKQVSSDSFQQDVIDPLIELIEKTKNIFDVNDNLYEEPEVSIPIFEKMPTFDVAASALALGNIGNVIDTFNSGSTFDSVDYNDSHDAVVPEGDVTELIAEKKFLDEIEAIMNSEEVSDSEVYAELEKKQEKLNREAEQRRQQLEEENKQKIFDEINEVLEESDSFKPFYNALSSDLIKQMLKTRIKGILSNNNLTVRTRINDVINILKNFRKVYTKGSFNNETGSTLESLFFDPNIAIGIHRAGLTDGQVIVDEGLKLTGDMSSGSFDIDQTRLSKNISFFSQNNLISYLGFLNSINTAHNYKTYGADNADVVIFAFPKDAIIDYEKANLTKYPDLVIKNEDGQYVVNSKYMIGHLNNNNGVVGNIVFNKNYNINSSNNNVTNIENVNGSLDNIDLRQQAGHFLEDAFNNKYEDIYARLNTKTNIQLQDITKEALEKLGFYDYYGSWYIYSTNNGINENDNTHKLYLRVNESDIVRAASIIKEYLKANNLSSQFKIGSVLRNDSFVVRVAQHENVNINQIINDIYAELYKNKITIQPFENPFIPNTNNIGVVTEVQNKFTGIHSYNSFLNKSMSLYLKQIDDVNNININDFFVYFANQLIIDGGQNSGFGQTLFNVLGGKLENVSKRQNKNIDELTIDDLITYVQHWGLDGFNEDLKNFDFNKYLEKLGHDKKIEVTPEQMTEITNFLDSKGFNDEFSRKVVTQFITRHTEIFGDVIPFETLMERLYNSLDNINLINIDDAYSVFGQSGVVGRYDGFDKKTISIVYYESYKSDSILDELFPKQPSETEIQMSNWNYEHLIHELVHAAYTTKGTVDRLNVDKHIFRNSVEGIDGKPFTVSGTTTYMEAIVNYITARIIGKKTTSYHAETLNFAKLTSMLGEEDLILSAFNSDIESFKKCFDGLPEGAYDFFTKGIDSLGFGYRYESASATERGSKIMDYFFSGNMSLLKIPETTRLSKLKPLTPMSQFDDSSSSGSGTLFTVSAESSS